MSLVTLKELMQDAEREGYAVGMFNATNLELTRGIIAAAEAEGSPIILALAEVHVPLAPMEWVAPLLVRAAERARVPVAVHLDHGMNHEVVAAALEAGFTSIMYDGSTLPYEENCARTMEVVELCRRYGASVEAELGHVGGAEGGGEDGQDEAYTDPVQALDFVNRTGVDALAVAIGTAHGHYVKSPVLDLERLSAIRSRLELPLVLHGGSGLSDDDFRSCIQRGIRKINVFTDMSTAAVERLRKDAQAKISYPELMHASIEAIREAVTRKIRLFGSSGRA